MPEGRTATRVPAQKLLGGHRRPWRRLIAASDEVEEPLSACMYTRIHVTGMQACRRAGVQVTT